MSKCKSCIEQSKSLNEFNFEHKLLKIRKDLPKMNSGEEILAKLPNNIWFYKCRIKELVGDYKYKVLSELEYFLTICSSNKSFWLT